jgi:hypothetical protein
MRSQKPMFVRGALGGYWTVLPAMLLTIGLTSTAQAESFKISQSLSTQTNASLTTKEGSAPLRIGAGRLTSSGVAEFVAGSNKEEAAAVAFDGAYDGSADNLKGLSSQVMTFADGSTIKLYMQMTGKGSKFEGSIVGSDGTGRFKGIRARGSLTGAALDPALNFIELQGDYDLSR